MRQTHLFLIMLTIVKASKPEKNKLEVNFNLVDKEMPSDKQPTKPEESSTEDLSHYEIPTIPRPPSVEKVSSKKGFLSTSLLNLNPKPEKIAKNKSSASMESLDTVKPEKPKKPEASVQLEKPFSFGKTQKKKGYGSRIKRIIKRLSSPKKNDAKSDNEKSEEDLTAIEIAIPSNAVTPKEKLFKFVDADVSDSVFLKTTSLIRDEQKKPSVRDLQRVSESVVDEYVRRMAGENASDKEMNRAYEDVKVNFDEAFKRMVTVALIRIGKEHLVKGFEDEEIDYDNDSRSYEFEDSSEADSYIGKFASEDENSSESRTFMNKYFDEMEALGKAPPKNTPATPVAAPTNEKKIVIEGNVSPMKNVATPVDDKKIVVQANVPSVKNVATPFDDKKIVVQGNPSKGELSASLIDSEKNHSKVPEIMPVFDKVETKQDKPEIKKDDASNLKIELNVEKKHSGPKKLPPLEEKVEPTLPNASVDVGNDIQNVEVNSLAPKQLSPVEEKNESAPLKTESPEVNNLQPEEQSIALEDDLPAIDETEESASFSPRNLSLLVGNNDEDISDDRIKRDAESDQNSGSDQSADQSNDQSADQNSGSDQSADQNNGSDQSADQNSGSDQSADQSNSTSADQSMNISQASVQSNNQSDDQSNNQSADQSNEQSDDQSNNENDQSKKFSQASVQRFNEVLPSKVSVSANVPVQLKFVLAPRTPVFFFG